MSHQPQAQSVTYAIRLREIYDRARNTSALPDEIEASVRADEYLTERQREGTLRNFYVIASNWSDWNFYAAMRPGMKTVTRHVDGEFYDDTPLEFGQYDWTMPISQVPGRDWRLGTFDMYGDDTDDAPLDVTWNFDQIGLLGSDTPL